MYLMSWEKNKGWLPGGKMVLYAIRNLVLQLNRSIWKSRWRWSRQRWSWRESKWLRRGRWCAKRNSCRPDRRCKNRRPRRGAHVRNKAARFNSIGWGRRIWGFNRRGRSLILLQLQYGGRKSRWWCKRWRGWYGTLVRGRTLSIRVWSGIPNIRLCWVSHWNSNQTQNATILTNPVSRSKLYSITDTNVRVIQIKDYTKKEQRPASTRFLFQPTEFAWGKRKTFLRP